jgi:hypothetical protein
MMAAADIKPTDTGPETKTKKKTCKIEQVYCTVISI